MQFADCRERNDREKWWRKAIKPDGNVNRKELLKHTTLEDVEDFLCLMSRVNSHGRCVACGQYFIFGDALGRWQCKSPVTGRKQDHHQPCEDKIDTRPPDFIISGWHYLGLVDAGLLSADHGEMDEARYSAEFDPNSGQLARMCIKRRST